MTRSTRTTTEIKIVHVAKPYGPNQENGPHLADLRAFVDECADLPADLPVRIDMGHTNEGGRRNATLSVKQTINHAEEPEAE